MARVMRVIHCAPASRLGLSPRILNSNIFSYSRLSQQRSMSFSPTGSSPPPVGSESSTPPTPRPSACLILVNERNEILLVRRNPKAVAFGGMHVFPGGNFDKTQDMSLAMTAIRETFEESGLLLASSPSSAPPLLEAVLDEARHKIHQQKLLFENFLQSKNLEADVEFLLPFTQWITPIGPPRRFHTQFYVAFLPTAPSGSSGFSSVVKPERIPTHDGGQEVIEARFIHPQTALTEFREGSLSFMPPQYYLLSTLADILEGPANTLSQRERVQTLSKGLFGKMVISPQRSGNDGVGRTILTYEGDETRGGSKGRLHRALVKMTSGNTTSEILLIRNFDIFSEIEPQAFSASPKL